MASECPTGRTSGGSVGVPPLVASAMTSMVTGNEPCTGIQVPSAVLADAPEIVTFAAVRPFSSPPPPAPVVAAAVVVPEALKASRKLPLLVLDWSVEEQPAIDAARTSAAASLSPCLIIMDFLR